MAMLKSLNKISSAPPAPAEIPDSALVLIEIGGQVYKVDYATLKGAGPAPEPTPPTPPDPEDP